MTPVRTLAARVDARLVTFVYCRAGAKVHISHVHACPCSTSLRPSSATNQILPSINGHRPGMGWRSSDSSVWSSLLSYLVEYACARPHKHLREIADLLPAAASVRPTPLMRTPPLLPSPTRHTLCRATCRQVPLPGRKPLQPSPSAHASAAGLAVPDAVCVMAGFGGVLAGRAQDPPGAERSRYGDVHGP